MNNPLTTLREELYESYGELVGLGKEELAGAYTKFIDLAISRTLDLVSEEVEKMVDENTMSDDYGTGELWACTQILSRIQELKAEKLT